ncbi:MAG: transglycosylase SLT domain-containing protein [Pseudonocardiaceae bacterium]
MQASAAAGTGSEQQIGPVTPMAMTGVAPAPTEVVSVEPAVDPAVDLHALGRAVERADRAAAEAAAQAAREEALQNRLGKPYQAGNNHSLDGWIAKALGLMGLPQALSSGVKEIIMHESTGNPDAINLYDSNASAGHPSQGLMQTIPSTFRQCVLPSLADRSITDPVANITAGVRSMIAHHGIRAVLNGGLHDSNGDYLGYGGAGCSSYDIAQYAGQLRGMWTDEPVPESSVTAS